MMNGQMGSFENGMMNGGIGGYHTGINSFGWFQGFDLSMLLLIGIVIFGLYLLMKRKKQPVKKESIFVHEKTPSLDAGEVVRLRYARGEITFEEFQTILKTLG